MASTMAAYLLIGIYLGTDARFQTGAQARSLTPDEADRKSTQYISLPIWMGAGLAASNWIIFAIFSLAGCLSYLYRMQTEEAMLMAKFGKGYEDYMRRTRRLIPCVCQVRPAGVENRSPPQIIT